MHTCMTDMLKLPHLEGEQETRISDLAIASSCNGGFHIYPWTFILQDVNPVMSFCYDLSVDPDYLFHENAARATMSTRMS